MKLIRFQAIAFKALISLILVWNPSGAASAAESATELSHTFTESGFHISDLSRNPKAQEVQNHLNEITNSLLKDSPQFKKAHVVLIDDVGTRSICIYPEAATQPPEEVAIEQTRNQTMKTLGPEGAEFNHQVERDFVPMAEKVYATHLPHSLTGYQVEVMRPVHWMQDELDRVPEISKGITVYPTIEFTRLTDLDDEALRKKLAQQIYESELDAAFKKGAFDPESSTHF